MNLSSDQIKLCEAILASHDSQSVYLVGGAVRDILRGKSGELLDLDLVYQGDVRQFARKLAESISGQLKVFDNFLTAKIISPRLLPSICSIDLASTRSEVYHKPAALPVVKLTTLENDLARRDFTVNAMALPLSALIDWHRSNYNNQIIDDALIDRYAGRSDLENGIIRVLHDNSFVDDPTRLIRMARYAVRLSLKLDEKTKQLKDNALASSIFNKLADFRKKGELQVLANENLYLESWKWLRETNIMSSFLNITPSSVIEIERQLEKHLLDDYQSRLTVTLGYLLEITGMQCLLTLGYSKKQILEIKQKHDLFIQQLKKDS